MIAYVETRMSLQRETSASAHYVANLPNAAVINVYVVRDTFGDEPAPAEIILTITPSSP